jgi:hypothetical protein
MEIIIHRVNEIKFLSNIPSNYGIEIDIRSQNSKLILNHEPHKNGDLLTNFLENYNHGTLILNIKEAGIEKEVLKLVQRFKIQSYFLLDVEIPFLFSAMKENIKEIAVRYSEFEPINFCTQFNKIFDWVWIDTPYTFPLNKEIDSKLINFKKCLVCPERWNREHDIIKYKDIIYKNNFKIDAVMTSFETSKYWV